MDNCLFCKLAAKELPAGVVYETEAVLAFLDIRPVHPGHVLVIPKQHSNDLSEAGKDELAPLIEACHSIGNALLKLGAEGYNVITNVKPAAGQIVFHTHFHVIPRYKGDGLAHWPQAPYSEGEDKLWQNKIRRVLQ
jgi:histidine triad (HIT) family protein